MISLKIKTPLWTGDIDGRSDSLQSTGIIGSLRWWIETILRGMDKFACDPVDNNSGNSIKRCPALKENNHDIAQYCPACLIFGATGKRRMFKLRMNGGTETSIGLINIKPNGRNRGWFLGRGLVGNINLDIIPFEKDFDENIILVPLTIASKYGAIGAKTQHGYGIFEFENYPEIRFDSFKETLKAVLKKEGIEKLKIEERNGGENFLPNIKEMFFTKVQFEAQDDNWWKEVDGIKERGRAGDGNYYKGCINDSRMVNWVNSGSIPIPPAIKNWLRFGGGKSLWKTGDYNNKDRRIENWLFGSIKNGKSASKINISCAYRINNSIWEFRVWGWIPENSPFNPFSRKDFLDNLMTSLDGSGQVKIPWNSLFGSKTKKHKLEIWREFDSSRDTVKPKEKNIENYLQSLIRG
ncbi:MAG: type III-B CRISPR module RAMP protein Cmr1 [Candidatus Fischerbacteria bacterium RBG_13_37_8]|uniref:Type III-B CRISPR module RAMP protein Cmr1 n=1 Tax=Candidatus Fischerbacteria bacterium RBG_13_37_8 TaxID=1817863 RepID=A0A1F5VY90_9BACT|nr:MAG: type III-B CRISPR module RAMP protein Cmr1 [Candidatus Fischerbacteria bacterium RBG_13_37_8]